MSIATKIQWCDSTCNPTMGCEGCELWNSKTDERACYAGQLHVRYGGSSKGYSPTFEQVTFWPGRMAEASRWRDLTGTRREHKPWLDGLPRLVFVSDMSDALSKAVPFDFLEAEIVRTVTSPDGRRHHWLWLTKRPEQMAGFCDSLRAKGVAWPENLWAGTSITTQATIHRVACLRRVGDEKTIRFLSVEPQREKIDFGECLSGIDWVIQGGESGRGARAFHVEWARELIRRCADVGVAYFLKQLGSNVHSGGRRVRFNDTHAGDWSKWPEGVRVRQMPRRVVESYRVGSVSVAEGVHPNGRVSLPVVEVVSKGRQAALKAWDTRRKNAKARKHSEAARKAWATRREKLQQTG